MDKDKVQGALIIGLAAIVLILLKDRQTAPQQAPGQTYIVQGASGGGGGVTVGGVEVRHPVGGICPCYY